MKRYRKTGQILAEPYTPVKGEFFDPPVSVAEIDFEEFHGDDPHGMIAQDPENERDRWYISRRYFAENYEEVDDD